MNDLLMVLLNIAGALMVFGAIYGLIKLFGLDATVFAPVPVEPVRPADEHWLDDLRDAPTQVIPPVVEGVTEYPDGRLVAPPWSAAPLGPEAPPVPMTGLLFDPLPVADDWDPPLFAELALSTPMTAITHHALNGRQLALAGASSGDPR